jgi:hypothetical protein
MAKRRPKGKGGGPAGEPPDDVPDDLCRIRKQRGRVRKAAEAEQTARNALRKAKAAAKLEQAALNDLIDGDDSRPLLDAIEEAGRRRKVEGGPPEAAEAAEAEDEPWRESLRDDPPLQGPGAAGPPADDTTWRHTPLAELTLTVRILRALESQGFTKLGPLVDATAAGLKLDDIRGISKSAAQIIAQAIADHWTKYGGADEEEA